MLHISREGPVIPANKCPATLVGVMIVTVLFRHRLRLPHCRVARNVTAGERGGRDVGIQKQFMHTHTNVA